MSLSIYPDIPTATANLVLSFNSQTVNAASVSLTIIVWKADAQMDFLDLFFKQILLVEEKHDGGQCKESVVADTVE